ncbi:MAG TPA: YbhB/YbcL family Raf kinase inhibitor-like protein [Candidatus Krumholzibacteria bacterium]|nr:YbhB/YbcL family Raf kinase inhibitor-like protein [Candidatus Krumholzibacteria bacterium]
MNMRVSSEAFDHGDRIPVEYSQDGDNLSPPLEIEGVPEGAEEIVLLAYDPDAPTPHPWVHWLVYGIPPGVRSLPEGIRVSPRPERPPGARQGLNTSGDAGYEGPAPPVGDGVHELHFKAYALDQTLDLEPGADPQTVLEVMLDHVIDYGELVGTFERRS